MQLSPYNGKSYLLKLHSNTGATSTLVAIVPETTSNNWNVGREALVDGASEICWTVHSEVHKH